MLLIGDRFVFVAATADNGDTIVVGTDIVRDRSGACGCGCGAGDGRKPGLL